MTYFNNNFIENFVKAKDLLNEYWRIESDYFDPFQDEEDTKLMITDSLNDMNERYKDSNLSFQVLENKTNELIERKLIITEKDHTIIGINFSEVS